MEILQRVFDRVCNERGLKANGPEAEGLARRLFHLHEQGVTEEEDLVSATGRSR